MPVAQPRCGWTLVSAVRGQVAHLLGRWDHTAQAWRDHLAQVASKRRGLLERPRSHESEATSGQPPRINSRGRTKASVGPQGRTERSRKSPGGGYRALRRGARSAAANEFAVAYQSECRPEAPYGALETDGSSQVQAPIRRTCARLLTVDAGGSVASLWRARDPCRGGARRQRSIQPTFRGH